jgi:hypothetical protein
VKRKLFLSITAVAIVIVVLLSLFLVQNWFSSNHESPREFYVGVMFAYGNQTSQVKALVDQVKDYTNLFVLGSVDLFHNESALTESCDYISSANLSIIVQFRGLDRYNYSINDWMQFAHARYGSQFLGIYRYDEPGGRQLDGTPNIQLINSTAAGPNPTYNSVSTAYVGNLSVFPNYYLHFTPQIFTADYALYWFSYKSNYSAIFAEFVGNESRERHLALCRGAADTFGKNWGVIVTWKYNQSPYLENGYDLYNDLTLAYSTGAKYAVVFSYPETSEYGTLKEDHFVALQNFWSMLHANPSSFGKNSAEAAYVVPADYGFGFRSPTDTIWGLFPADKLSTKIYGDVQTLTERYGAKLNILYDSPEVYSALGNYSEVYFWNQTIS